MKKGFELALNFIVTIIIALVIFAFGVTFVYNLVDETKEFSDLSIDEIDRQIGELLCESNDRICIGVGKLTISKGKIDYFGIKIINAFTDSNDKDFQIIVTPTKGFTSDDAPIDDGVVQKINLRYGPSVNIERNSKEDVGIAVLIPKDMVSGRYILDVTVTVEGQPYGTLHKLYVNVP